MEVTSMQGLPTIRNYGDYASSNYGAHTLAVSIGQITVYFSYKTPVAFETPHGLVCSENVWSTTTGKHLNWIEPDKTKRVSNLEFERRFSDVVAQFTEQASRCRVWKATGVL